MFGGVPILIRIQHYLYRYSSMYIQQNGHLWWSWNLQKLEDIFQKFPPSAVDTSTFFTGRCFPLHHPPRPMTHMNFAIGSSARCRVKRYAWPRKRCPGVGAPRSVHLHRTYQTWGTKSQSPRTPKLINPPVLLHHFKDYSRYSRFQNLNHKGST